MTSQIAIFNPLGVAVASDTVATLINEHGTKTQNNAEKMWPLSEEHRVVIALNNSFSINDVPASLLISAWNRTLKRPLPTLVDYVVSFRDWLHNDTYLVNPDSDFSVMSFALKDHFNYMRRHIIETARNQNMDDGEVETTFSDAANRGHNHLLGLKNFDDVEDSDDLELLDASPIDIDAMLNLIFEGFPGYDKVKTKLIEQAPLVLSRLQKMDSDTNLTFIGFGENDYFGSSIEFQIRGRYGKSVRGNIAESFPPATHYTSGNISALAQRDAILGFSYGAEDRVLNRMKQKMWEYLIDLHEDEDAGMEAADNFIDQLTRDIDQFSFETYLSPLLRTVEFLNLSDAAEFAESLVGIQAMRAKASPHPAGVGGFIESLVIDKFSGVRWIKRLPK